VLKLGDKLIPPANSFTGGKQEEEEDDSKGANPMTGEGGDQGGRPSKEADDKKD
jgi:hypothetical protein